MFGELERNNAIFDLPASKFFLGDPAFDLGVRFHGHHAATPLGPAAGPHSQLAQNIVLAWLGGSRIIELKTVQILDELAIPRPCIDMRNIGYNVEWSQELKLEQSLEEYVKAAMLIEILVASGKLQLAPGFDAVLYDMSVGYDLAGIRSDRVQSFIRGMMDATATIERLRAQIPDQYARFRDLPFRTRLSDTLTLSTFHGCPPDEIEGIIDFLLRSLSLNCVIKLNPTLLGRSEVRRLLHDGLGYRECVVPDTAFDKDTTWPQATGFIQRLRATARGLDLGLGVKFTNTLVVEHDGVFLPTSEQQKYLSGAPLHVLAMNLVGRLREHFGADVPISFSAGIDKGNFADAVALGLTPITVCSDLLRPGGYARQAGYLQALTQRMAAVSASHVQDFIIKAYGHATESLQDIGSRTEKLDAAIEAGGDLRESCDGETHAAWVRAAMLRNTRTYTERVTADPRYALASNRKLPKKIGSELELFDCITCDKCVPVCPNDANFTLSIEPRRIAVQRLRQVDGAWQAEEHDVLTLDKKHQIASFADFCNECGNCDIFCPEDGGPYIVKPRFFGSQEQFDAWPDHDGFYLDRRANEQRVLARIGGQHYRMTSIDAQIEYSGPGFVVEFSRGDPAGTVRGAASGDVDLGFFHIMDVVREAVCDSDDVNWVSDAVASC